MPIAILCIVTITGTGISFGTNGILTYILTLFIFVLFTLIKKPKVDKSDVNEKLRLGAYILISTLSVQAVNILLNGVYQYDILAGIFFGITTYIFYKIFTNSIPVIYEYGIKKAFSVEEVMGTSLLVAIAISALGGVTIYGFSLKNILCILVVLILGWKNGMLVGATSGTTIGVVLGIIGHGDPVMVASYALSRTNCRNPK